MWQDLPTFLGGQCPRAINGIPNDQTKPNVAKDSDGMQKITVANGDKYDVFFEVRTWLLHPCMGVSLHLRSQCRCPRMGDE